MQQVEVPNGSKNPTGGSTPSSSSKAILRDAPDERATRPAGANAAANHSIVDVVQLKRLSNEADICIDRLMSW